MRLEGADRTVQPMPTRPTQSRPQKPTLESIRFMAEPDPDPDLSYLGEYTDSPHGKNASLAIDRKERGHLQRGQFRFWVPAMSPKETGNPESVEQDYLRSEAYNSDQWGMVGIWAEATISVPDDSGQRIQQQIRSGGLWGIETDSDKAYLQTVAMEELTALLNQLRALGVKVPKGTEVESKTYLLQPGTVA